MRERSIRTTRTLIEPQEDLKKLFTRRELERYKRDLGTYSQGKQSQIGKWKEITGGIDREEYGVHVDLADRKKLTRMVDRWVKSLEKS